MRVVIDGKKATFSGRLDGAVLDKLREIPGRSKWVGRDLVFEATAGTLSYMRVHFSECVFVDPQKRMEQIDALARLEADAEQLKRAELPPEASQFPFKTTPREHQLRAFHLMRDREYFALFMEMGTGKTKTTIDIIAHKWATGAIDCVLVFAPNGVHNQWHDSEMPRHMPEFVGYTHYAYKSGKKTPAEMFKASSKLRILYMNIEAMSHKSGIDAATQFVISGNCFIVVDESTTIKNPTSQRSKNVRKLRANSVARAILCGAPVTRSITDMFGQMMFLHEDALGYSSKFAFEARYCDMVPAYRGAPRGVTRVVGYRNMDEFVRKVDAHSFRVTKDQCLDLPPKVYLERLVEMTPEQRRMYKELAKDCFTELNGSFIDVDNAMAKMLRLQQLLCGHTVDEDGNVLEVPSHRIRDLLEWRAEAGKKAIIWARFKYDIEAICAAWKKAGIPFARYDGSTPRSEREEGEKRYLSTREEVDMIANPAAAARGKNWQLATDVAYYSNSFDADLRWQSEDRTHRDGMIGSCTYTDFITNGTVERHIVNTLRDRKNLADSVLDNKLAWLEILSDTS